MKRSEMIEAIAEEFLKLYGGGDDEWEPLREETKIKRIKMAAMALKAAEENGMMPPSYKTPWIEEINPPEIIDGIPMVGFITEKTVNQWEPEDE